MEFAHTSVLLEESIEALNIRPDGIYVDGTLGGGGHSFEICSRLGSEGRLIGIDRDAEAIEAAAKRLENFEDRVTIVRENFCRMKAVLDNLGIQTVNGVILDLGVSSHQLDDAGRGFTYREDAPLDMRMDQRQALTAADVVNTYSKDDLTRILREYGEERFAGRIASRIVSERKVHIIETTGELIKIIKESIPAKKQSCGRTSGQKDISGHSH